MPFSIDDDVKKIRYDIINNHIYKYAFLGVIFLKLCIDAMHYSFINWILIIGFLIFIYILYNEDFFKPRI